MSMALAAHDSVAVRTEPARRKPTYADLNVLRVVLAVSVLLYHLSGTLALDKYFGVDVYARLLGFGGARVPFFFVLSGFVLTLAYARDVGHPQRALPFLRRRFVRLYPTYWIILALVMSPALFVPSLRQAIPSDPMAVLKMLALWPDHRGAALPTGAPVIVVAWTLHYEIAFCLLLATWIVSRPLGLLLTAALALNAWSCGVTECSGYRQFLAGGSMGYFASGAVSAWLAPRLPAMPRARLLAGMALVAYLFIAVTARGGQEFGWLPDKNLFFVALACVVLICLVQAPAAQSPAPQAAWVQLLSDASYALYLLHFPLISLVCKLVVHAGLHGAVGAAVAFVSAVCVCIGSAVVFHLRIERHLLAWR